jgi:uncharacterized protein YjbJ (UPF0337 family)
MMKWNQIERRWTQRIGKSVHKKINMNDERLDIMGKYEGFIGILQEKYGIAKEEAKRQVDAFKNLVEQFKNPIGS